MAKYPKKPKAPKSSASTASMEGYLTRVKEWEKKCKAIDADKKKKETLKKKVAAIKNKR